ncbi:hypothetical protein K2173_023195 [Erythroxylum novogranatense]|uniref:Small ribosomal subunit protein uS2c n=1 Tax=Erythroxylum novogranatense TaxID=1862640 RepID=A0AAV8UAN8_9ROSI|nr:hypothetical protein K2173_023195 [Erythroxylum novogranatense]
MIIRYWNINLEDILEAGVHFGHGTRKWNPRMGPYIFAKHKGIHITNLTKTTRFLSKACDLVFDAARRRKQFLIVGTTKNSGFISAGGNKSSNETSKVQGLKNGTEDRKTELPYERGDSIKETQEEYTALQECITLGIPTICLIDTNSDPDLADISFPVNDVAMF